MDNWTIMDCILRGWKSENKNFSYSDNYEIRRNASMRTWEIYNKINGQTVITIADGILADFYEEKGRSQRQERLQQLYSERTQIEKEIAYLGGQ